LSNTTFLPPEEYEDFPQTMEDRTPYTYLIGWSNCNQWYYGVRYGKNCHPSDLWKTYFTSSKDVKKMIDEVGNPDIIQIRNVFWTPKHPIKVRNGYVRIMNKNLLNTADEVARYWEATVLNRMRVHKKEEWINNASWRFCVDPKIQAENARKQGYKNKGKKRSKEYVEDLKIRMKGSGNPMFGKKRTEEWCKNHSEKMKGKKVENPWILGKTKENNQSVLKMSETLKERFKIKENHHLYNKQRYTNGIINVACTKEEASSLSSDFYPGMTIFKKEKLHWYNNGKETFRVTSEEAMAKGLFNGRIIRLSDQQFHRRKFRFSRQ